jgi:guanine deaminase
LSHLGQNLEAQNGWMKRAIDLALENVRTGRGGPFGALVVRRGDLVATGVNLVTATNDPSAHAEVVAIRAACQVLGSFQLPECEVYSSCEPCPMCLGAIYWARPNAYYYACNRANAAQAGFDDAFIYDEIPLPPAQRSIAGIQLLPEMGSLPFDEWFRSTNKTPY